MNKVQKNVDFNAHVTNLKCDVFSKNGNAFGTLGFTNMCFGTLTAVKFIAKGYNSFGDIVTANGKEEFFVILQDLNIAPNTKYGDVKIKFPNSEIRKVSLTEGQLCYSDGTVISYGGADWAEYEIDCLDPKVEDESKILEILKDYEQSAVCLPVDTINGWICICGNLNKTGSSICILCGKEKYTTFNMCTGDAIKTSIENKRIQKEENEYQQKHLEAKKAKQRILRNSIIALVSITAIVLISLIINASVLSGRVTFTSEAEMKSYLSGTWWMNEISGITLTFTNNSVIHDWDDPSIEPMNLTDYVNYYPKRGYITIFGDQYILKKGTYGEATLTSKDDSYSRTSSSTSGLYIPASENASDVLKISGLSLTSNSVSTICAGSMKNTGNNTYEFVEVKGVFKDSGGTVLDTDWTYAVGSEGLAPGESSTFEMFVNENYKIHTCSVSLLDYDVK